MAGLFKLLSAATTVGLVACTVACSGAGNQDLFEPSAEQDDTSATLPATSPANPGTGSPSLPAPAPPAKDAGTSPPPPPLEPPVCTPENEPNDDVNEATPFTTGLCGKIAGSNDVDFGRFVAPQNAKSITWKHDEDGGQVSYRFFVGGVQVPAVGDGALRVVPGATYVVQIRSANGNGGNRPKYELTVTIQ